MAYKKKPTCRCGRTRTPEGACPDGCPLPGQQPRRRRTVGIADPHDDIGSRKMRAMVDAAVKRIGVPSKAWAGYKGGES
jgi:hypothetical protein